MACKIYASEEANYLWKDQIKSGLRWKIISGGLNILLRKKLLILFFFLSVRKRKKLPALSSRSLEEKSYRGSVHDRLDTLIFMVCGAWSTWMDESYGQVAVPPNSKGYLSPSKGCPGVWWVGMDLLRRTLSCSKYPLSLTPSRYPLLCEQNCVCLQVQQRLGGKLILFLIRSCSCHLPPVSPCQHTRALHSPGIFTFLVS